MYCAPVKKWLITRAKALDMGWLTLAGKLDLGEECADDEDLSLPSCTERLKVCKERLVLARLVRHPVGCRYCCKGLFSPWQADQCSGCLTAAHPEGAELACKLATY